MSFSVTAAEFVPSSLRADGNTTGDNSSNTSVNGTVPLKSVVCTQYFSSCQCPLGTECHYAHHFDELEPRSRLQLIGIVGGEERLPAHFVMPIRMRRGIIGSNGVMEGAHCAMPVAGSGIPLTSLHMNGHTGSNNGFINGTGNNINNNNNSNNNKSGRQQGVVPTFLQAEVKMTLPQRCHYPHSSPGTYYDHLNLKPYATTNEINAAYQRWRKGGYKQTKQVDAARADMLDKMVVDAKLVLSNPSMRNEYDRILQQRGIATGNSLLVTPNGVTSTTAAVSAAPVSSHNSSTMSANGSMKNATTTSGSMINGGIGGSGVSSTAVTSAFTQGVLSTSTDDSIWK